MMRVKCGCIVRDADENGFYMSYCAAHLATPLPQEEIDKLRGNMIRDYVDFLDHGCQTVQ